VVAKRLLSQTGAHLALLLMIMVALLLLKVTLTAWTEVSGSLAALGPINVNSDLSTKVVDMKLAIKRDFQYLSSRWTRPMLSFQIWCNGFADW
jgi:hypothetical protein